MRKGADRVSSRSGDEAVAHDNGSLESGTAGPVDIILVDETHSASIVHHNDISSNSENLMPTISVPPRTPSIDLHSHHHKNSLKARTRASHGLLPNSTVSSTHTGFTSFQSFHTPTSSISDGYEPYHSAQSFSSFSLALAFILPSLHNHRSVHSLSTISSSTASKSIAPTINYTRTTRQ